MVKIFVGRLVESVDKEKLTELFSKYGEVIDCEVMKNFGFVHMADKKEAEKAIAELDKSEVDGQPINVEFSVTKVASAAKIFVGNLAEGTQAHELHKLFKKYGTVIECDVVKNYAFVHMSRESQAREAIKELDDYELNGNKIRVKMSKARGQGGGRGGYGGPSRGRGGSRQSPYDYDGYDDDGYDMPMRSRGYSRGMGRMAYDGGMRRDGLSQRRGGPSYMRLLRERAMLARRLLGERGSASGYRDEYSASGFGGAAAASSRLSRAYDAYTDFAVDDFPDLPLDGGMGLDASALDRYGGASAYGGYY